jgi:hypothetical protein
MRRCLIALATIVHCLQSAEAFSQQLSSDAEIKSAIARLGEETDSEGFGKFEILYKNPRRSTELLIATLKPIRLGQYVEGKHPQVVWNIRALRSLTGLNFRGPTQADLTGYEAHFLDHDPTTQQMRSTFSALGCPVTGSGSHRWTLRLRSSRNGRCGLENTANRLRM